MKTQAGVKMLLLSALLLALPLPGRAQSNVTTISGTVRDESGEPLPGVVIHVEGPKVSDLLTGRDGSFSFVLLGATEATLQFSLRGFQPLTRTLALHGGKVPVDVQLTSLRVQLRMTSFVRAKSIDGRVTGLDPRSYGAYKVVAYVLTNKWYIHPEAVDTPGQGYAEIAGDGSFHLSTVWRGYQATKLAFVLVPRETWMPPTVELTGGRPEPALLSQIEGIEASLILKAPEGI